MKYLIIQPADGAPFAVFCCAPQTHAEMARAWRRTPASRVLSAGYCSIVAQIGAPALVTTYGHSASLNLGPREEDAPLIAAFLTATATLCPPEFRSNARIAISPKR